MHGVYSRALVPDVRTGFEFHHAGLHKDELTMFGDGSQKSFCYLDDLRRHDAVDEPSRLSDR